VRLWLLATHFLTFWTASACLKLLKTHSDLAAQYARVLPILAADPYNRSGSYPIKRLAGVKPGEGQYRIRFQRYRFIYDIEGKTVFLKLCRLRREDTYN
jgi:mRNA-degrading endonuclease RelE of RelBE toxin-antitoxin system